MTLQRSAARESPSQPPEGHAAALPPPIGVARTAAALLLCCRVLATADALAACTTTRRLPELHDEACHVVAAEAARLLRIFSDAVVQELLDYLWEGLALFDAARDELDDVLVRLDVPDTVAGYNHELVVRCAPLADDVRGRADHLLLGPEVSAFLVLQVTD